MSRNDPLLSLLGLCLRGRNLAVGEDAASDAAERKAARLLLTAQDAADATRRRAARIASIGECLLLPLPFSKSELGAAVGRAETAVVAVTDLGLAETIAKRLVERDPKQYAEAAEKLALKAKRAAERKAKRETAEKRETPREAPKPPQDTPKSPRKKPSYRPRGAKSAAREDAPKKPRAYAHSRPVKKGKGSFRKK